MIRTVDDRDLEVDGPSSPLRGRYRPPSDKSISLRALLLSALASGESTIDHLLDCDDVTAMRGALTALGVAMSGSGETLRVRGPLAASRDLDSPRLDAFESGTTARLLLGALVGARVRAIVSGRGSLLTRPMRRVVDPLRAMGALIESANPGGDPDRLPLRIEVAERLRPSEHQLAVASAQVKSALLLAGLGVAGETSVREPAPSRDHTERMLQTAGVPVQVAVDGSAVWIRTSGPAAPHPRRYDVPADPSSMLYLGVLALLVADSDLVAFDVCLNPTRTGALEVLKRMGADLSIHPTAERGGEPVGEVRFRSSELRGVDVEAELVPSLIDDIPILAVAASLACTESTRFHGVAELRRKESDRVASTIALVSAFGGDAYAEGDSLVIRSGKVSRGPVSRGTVSRGPASRGHVAVDSYSDHRIALCGLVLALATRNRTRVRDFAAVSKSYPAVLADLRGIGIGV